MDMPSLLYSQQALQGLGDFLTLPDWLSLATLSREFNQLLRRFLKERYSLSNQQGQTEFMQLRSLFDRRLFLYGKGDKFAKVSPAKFVLRSIEAQEGFTVVQTLDSQFRLLQTQKLLMEQPLELMPLPRNYKFVRISEAGLLYCAEAHAITRFELGVHGLGEGEVLELKGEVEGLICGGRFAVVVLRNGAEVRLRVFEGGEKLSNFKDIEAPFEVGRIKVEDQLAVAKNGAYVIFNEGLYELNLKKGTIGLHPQFIGKKVVKVLSGRAHFMVFQRTRELSQNWSTEQVVKFALEQGFDDFVKIFKAEKVSGRQLLQMDKKYMEEVLGIENHKVQQRLALRLWECNRENPQDLVLYGWGRAAEGQLGTNPSKEVLKPLRVKLPTDCELFGLAGNITFVENGKTGCLLGSSIQEKSNKLEWREIANRKVWGLSAVDDRLILIGSMGRDRAAKVAQAEEKRQKLRTAKNIIDKITWDVNLNKQEFRVGYLDKYEGLLQISFEELTRSEVKEYRIEYFKRGIQVVWDKKKRIDVL